MNGCVILVAEMGENERSGQSVSRPLIPLKVHVIHFDAMIDVGRWRGLAVVTGPGFAVIVGAGTAY